MSPARNAPHRGMCSFIRKVLLLTHDGEHCEAPVLELLELKLGESDRVVGVGVPCLAEVAELSRRLRGREETLQNKRCHTEFNMRGPCQILYIRNGEQCDIS